MNKNNQRVWVIAGIILAIIILFLIFKNDNDDNKMERSTTSSNQTPTSSNSSSTTPSASTTPSTGNGSTLPAPEGSFTLEGRLEKSDDPDKGSIKLVMNDKTIYLRSRQDYSSLYGKQVVIKAVGTSTVFRFDTIEEKK